MTARWILGAGALLLLFGCSTSRVLTDPRDSTSDRVATASQPRATNDSPVVRESEELAGTLEGADNAGEAIAVVDLIDSLSVLVDSLENVGALATDFPDISDSLAAATQARLPSFDEIFDYPVVVNLRVLTWIDVYTGKSKRTFEGSLRRSGRYLPMARQIFAEEGVPQDLAFLGHVESTFRHNARSPARALGLWQFMKGTAKDLGLRCDERVDERLDPEKSTRACARYLKQLHARYDDWLLALAAYNAGPGNVDRAIERSGSRDFWEIAKAGHLRHETRNFVPAILAATILSKSPKAYGLSEETDPPLVYDTVRVDNVADLGIIARCAGTGLDEVRALNPSLLHAQTPGTRGYEVRVPAGAGSRAKAQLAAIPPDELIAYVHHKVRAGDNLGSIAKRYGTSVRAIQDANGMGRSTLIHAGKSLKIPARGAARLEDGDLAAGGSSAPSDRSASHHRVLRGETVHSIARKHGVRAADLVAANRLTDPSRIQVGQVLEIPGTGRIAPPSGETPSSAAASSGRSPQARDEGGAGTGTGLAPEDATGTAAAGADAASLRGGDAPTLDGADAAAILGRVESTAHLVDQARAELQADTAPVPESSRTDPRADPQPEAKKASEARLHVVAKGDTLWKIARAYGVDVRDLMRWNGLRARSRIYPGQKIKVF